MKLTMPPSIRLAFARAGLAAALLSSAPVLAAPAVESKPAPALFAEFLRTSDLDLAAGAARRLIFDGMEPQVRRMADGDLAVVVGPKPIEDTDRETVRLMEERSPIPLRYAPAQAFGPPVQWRRPAAVAARVEYRAGKRARLVHDGLVVEVVRRKGPGGDRAPVMIGRLGGKVVFETPPREEAEGAPFGQVRLMRLDPAARRPAVVLTAYSGGMHCCTITTIASQQPDGRWTIAEGQRLDADGYEFEDVDGDGAIELTSIDNSFLYAFTSYNGSFAPPRVSRLEGGQLVDVTGRPSSRGFLRQSVQAMEFGRTPEQWRENGFLGGWVAAKSLLGEGRAAWAAMEPLHQAYSMFTPELCPDGAVEGCPDDQKRRIGFKEALATHLARNGYPLDQIPAGAAIPPPPGLGACPAQAAADAGAGQGGPGLFSCAP